jgi:hypothetical protein
MMLRPGTADDRVSTCVQPTCAIRKDRPAGRRISRGQQLASRRRPRGTGCRTTVMSASEQERVEPAGEANASDDRAHGQQCPADIRQRRTARVMTNG